MILYNLINIPAQRDNKAMNWGRIGNDNKNNNNKLSQYGMMMWNTFDTLTVDAFCVSLIK